MTYETANSTSLLPWHITQWESITSARQLNRLSHAFLLVGASGLGQGAFAERLASTLLCHAPDKNGNACTNCHACHLTQAKTHPDLMIVEPEQEGQMIKIDQIRGVVKCIHETAMQGGYRVVIIHSAHAMNTHSANALLKTLEEPTPNCLLILISDQMARLPATITSRCQKLTFQKPAPTMALAWLRAVSDAEMYSDEQLAVLLSLADGAPLKALSLANRDILAFRNAWYQGLVKLSQGQADPLALASTWHDNDWMMMLNLLWSWLRDLLRFKLTLGHEAVINADYQADLIGLASRVTHQKLVDYIEHVQVNYAKIVNLQNLNRQLLLEELLIRWTHLYVSG